MLQIENNHFLTLISERLAGWNTLSLFILHKQCFRYSCWTLGKFTREESDMTGDVPYYLCICVLYTGNTYIYCI